MQDKIKNIIVTIGFIVIILGVFITNIIRTYTKNEVCFIGCDYKKSDVYYFKKYNHYCRYARLTLISTTDTNVLTYNNNNS